MLKEALSETNVIEWPLFAFILFGVTFLVVVVRVVLKGSHDPRYIALANLPLEADTAAPSASEATAHDV